MVDPRHRRPVVPDAPPPREWRSRARLAAWIVGGLGVLVLGWVVLQAVRDAEAESRWEDLWRIDRERDRATDRSWLRDVQPTTIAERDEYIERLEKFLREENVDPGVAAQVHARLVNLQLEQVLAHSTRGTFELRRPRYEAAAHHLNELIDRYPDSPLVRSQYQPSGYVSEAHRLLATIEKNRAFDEKHGLRDVEPDADPVVLLRTDRGDLRLRFFGSDAKEHVRRFVERVCAGGLDGTKIFRKDDSDAETTLRGGDRRTSKADATLDDRATWGEPTEAPPVADEPARHRIVHRRGVVTAWHESSISEDDPEQFAIVVGDSPALDHENTPFAKAADAASLATIDRIFSERTFRQEQPDLTGDPKKRAIADQLVTPVTIKKALVYEKGVLSTCHDATKVRETEKRLETVVPDEDLAAAPPTPPPAPGVPPTSPPEGPDRGAAMQPGTPGTPDGETTPPAMDEAPR
jgi:cyclophilin family peptidyl-prolyl cis-trans isomerase